MEPNRAYISPPPTPLWLYPTHDGYELKSFVTDFTACLHSSQPEGLGGGLRGAPQCRGPGLRISENGCLHGSQDTDCLGQQTQARNEVCASVQQAYQKGRLRR